MRTNGTAGTGGGRFGTTRFAALGRRWQIVGAALAAIILFTGVLNLRSAFGFGDDPDWAVDPAAPSAMDRLVGFDRAGGPLDATILALQDALRADPGDARSAVYLGQAYLQQVRESGDPSYYPKAETLFRQALDADGRDFSAMVGLGSLALARHDFAGALEWGERASQVNPYHAPAHGVIVDALIELGRYDEAIVAAQTMVDLRPDLASFARVSYVRELMGDRDGAIAAMEQAALAGAARAEHVAWVQVQLGNLHFDGGDLDAAEAAYETSVRNLPDYPAALAGLGRVAAARGQYEEAVARYEAAIARVPLPEFVIALGDVHAAFGQPAEAERQYALVGAMQDLYAANGVDTDLEMALFFADHPERIADMTALVEQARAAYARRPSVRGADVLAWTLYRAGDYAGAKTAIDEALRLGTKDALMFFHAGTIEQALGNTEAAANYLRTALERNPHFSVRYAPEAEATLAGLLGDAA
jgi:tetratricopeptide (TPR) repeat protein